MEEDGHSISGPNVEKPPETVPRSSLNGPIPRASFNKEIPRNSLMLDQGAVTTEIATFEYASSDTEADPHIFG